MTEAERLTPARWFEEVWNKGRREAIAEMLSPDAVLHEGDTDCVGPEGFYPFYDRLTAALTEFQITVHDAFSEGEKVCARWTCTCTQTGDDMGMPATHTTIRVTGMSIMRIVDGRMMEGWQNWDMLGMLEQIRDANRSTTYLDPPEGSRVVASGKS